MKKFIALLLVATFLLSGSVVSAQTTATTNVSAGVSAYLNQLQILRQLRQGMSGEDVKALQVLLATQPDIYPEGLVTGYYGALTSKAVKKYQEKFGLTVVGHVGPLTRKKLNELVTFNATATATPGVGVAVAGTTTLPSAQNDGCVRIPPGHFIAPGWLKKHGGVAPAVPSCQALPPGIAKKLGILPPATTTPPVVDLTAPVISAVAVSSTTASTSRITWLTNELATTQVTYGTSSPVLSSSATTTPSIVSGLRFSHTVNLSTLVASSTYYFVISSADAYGNTATTSQISFTTLGL